MALLTLWFAAPTALAQDFSFAESIPVLEECLAGADGAVARQACIGQGAIDCEARYGWSSFTEAACLGGEADFWEARLQAAAYPARDGAPAAAAFAAWQAFVQAECSLAGVRFGQGTGQSSALADCRMQLHGERAAAFPIEASAGAKAMPGDAPPGWCASANLNPTERAICDTAALWPFDARLGDTYRALYGPGPLTDEQLAWLGKRNRCGGDAVCIEDSYRVRIAELSADRPARGTVLDLSQGDIACYVVIQAPDGAEQSFPGDFDLCLDTTVIGRTVALDWTQAQVMAASCEGNMDCTETDTVWLIDRLTPLN